MSGLETIIPLLVAGLGAGAQTYGAQKQQQGISEGGKKAARLGFGETLAARRNPINLSILDTIMSDWMGTPQGYGQTVGSLMGSAVPGDRALAEAMMKPAHLRSAHEQALVNLYQTQGMEGIRNRRAVMAAQYHASRKRSGPAWRRGADYMLAGGGAGGGAIEGWAANYGKGGRSGLYDPRVGLGKTAPGLRPQGQQAGTSGSMLGAGTGQLGPPQVGQGQVGQGQVGPGRFNADVVNPQSLNVAHQIGTQDVLRDAAASAARYGAQKSFGAEIQRSRIGQKSVADWAAIEQAISQLNRNANLQAMDFAQQLAGIYSGLGQS